jgi:hypothetical protein
MNGSKYYTEAVDSSLTGVVGERCTSDTSRTETNGGGVYR